MAVIRNVEVFWVKCDKNNPERYQGKGPAKWSVQLRVKDKKEKERLEKEFGFRFTPIEDDAGRLVYKTTISRYAFKSDGKGQEDLNQPNTPVSVVLGDLSPVDPNTVGNGSVVNLSFFCKEDKSSRTLKGMQVIKYKVYEPKGGGNGDEFSPVEDFEVINANPHQGIEDDGGDY